MFVLNLHYIKPLDAVENALPAHVAYLEKYYAQGAFLCSGRKNPRTGGIILCNAASRDEVESIVSEDPFHAQGIATCEIIEFTPGKYAEGFAPFIR